MKTLTFLILVAFLATASAQTYTFSTLAGEAGYGSDDGPGGAARFNSPQGLAVDGSGNLVVADSGNGTIRKISASGVVTTVAGDAGNRGSADGVGPDAQFNYPSGVAVDGSGNVFVADGWNNTIRKVTADGVVTTLAGLAGSSGSADGKGSAARFSWPAAMAIDRSGNLFVAERSNNTIRKITADGSVTTLAGSPVNSGSADGTGSAARFNFPSGVAVDGNGNVLVADSGNYTIRRITADGTVTTLAGSPGEFGSADGTGSVARFYRPEGVAVDGSGNIFVADSFNGTIRKITADGIVTTLAGSAANHGSVDGTGGDARFSVPTCVAVDGSGNLFVADSGNYTIRKITTEGNVTTLAGKVGGYGRLDGTGSDARFIYPRGVAVDGSGNVFVSEVFENDTFSYPYGAIRRITAGGSVVTLAGTVGESGRAYGTIPDARFSGPNGVAVDSRGNLFVADTYNGTIRRITADGVVTTVAGKAGDSGAADGKVSDARFHAPAAVAVDGSGNVFVADAYNRTIRRITADGVVTTLAGKARVSGSADGAGSDARFSSPEGVAVDGSGNVFVADRWNHTIRKITAGGVVTTLAGSPDNPGSVDGTGSVARFYYPKGVAVDGGGNVFVADNGNHTIRKITADGVVTTVAGMPGRLGNADGTGSAARFGSPWGVAVDRAGNLYVACESTATIRKGVPSASTAPLSRLVNFSASGFMPAGGDLMMGLVVHGTAAKSVLVRAVGPTLRNFGVSGTLSDPRLEVFSAGENAVIRLNDDWDSGPFLAATFASVGAFPLLPFFSKDAAVLGMLPVDRYTMRVTSSLAAESGIALAEVYDRDPVGAAGRFGNFSTLGFVGTGAQALTLGFVIDGAAPKRLLIRAVGPGLAPLGVAGLLGDPQLAIIPAGKTFPVASNDNWSGDAELASAFVSAGAFALPASSKDAAVVIRLPPGGYTVAVSGVADTTGRALVEIYDLDP